MLVKFRQLVQKLPHTGMNSGVFSVALRPYSQKGKYQNEWRASKERIKCRGKTAVSNYHRDSIYYKEKYFPVVVIYWHFFNCIMYAES
jgi:hypothetical protein